MSYFLFERENQKILFRVREIGLIVHEIIHSFTDSVMQYLVPQHFLDNEKIYVVVNLWINACGETVRLIVRIFISYVVRTNSCAKLDTVVFTAVT